MKPSSAGAPRRASGALEALDDAGRAEFWASLALRHTRGLGARGCKRLLAFFGSAFEAVQGTARWREAGVGPDKAALLASGSWRVTAREEWEACRGLSAVLLLWTDPRYPAQLRELPDPPVFLYCRGDMSLLGGPCLAVVGRRDCTRAGIRAATALARGVAAAGVTVVSGMALGIDRAAHLAALEQQGGTIAVLGAGLDVDYPGGNRDLRRGMERQGLLLTEYAPATPPSARHFPIRNRIISGLSLGVLVVEAAVRSGSLITARLALEQNRSVYVLPDPGASPEDGEQGPSCPAAGGSAPGARTEQEKGAPSEGCRQLLQQGAIAVASAEDILRDLGPQLRGSFMPQPRKVSGAAAEPAAPVIPVAPAAPIIPIDPAGSGSPNGAPGSIRMSGDPSLVSVEDRILAAIQREPVSADDLCRALRLSAAEVGAALVMLEVRGLARRLADLRYAPIRS